MTLQEAIIEIKTKLQLKGILAAIELEYDLDTAIEMVYNEMCGQPNIDLFVEVTYEKYLSDMLDKDAESICSC